MNAPRISDTIPINYIDEPVTKPKLNANPEYRALRDQYAIEQTAEVLRGEVTGQNWRHEFKA